MYMYSCNNMAVYKVYRIKISNVFHISLFQYTMKNKKNYIKASTFLE